MKPSSGIRLPAVAGLFYPADAGALRETVDAMLARADEPGRGRFLRGLVSPHAGYVYSGAAAARAFRLFHPESIRTVVMVGPSHVEAFDFTSVFDGEAYRTPLGDVPAATALARELADAAPDIILSPRGHMQDHLPRGEHGIEVQLPFLQRVAPHAEVLPIVMGSQDRGACESLGSALAQVCDPSRAVLLASSDLSHFHSYDDAVRLDGVFCDSLVTLDPEILHRALRERRCEACGAGPVLAVLLATRIWGAASCRILSRYNSGDVTGERDSVVGYASAALDAGGAS